MPPSAAHLDVTSVLHEVKAVRREGLVRLRELALPLLRRAAASAPGAATDSWPVEVEHLLRTAVARLGGGDLQRAAELTLGLPPGMRDRAAADRRKLAAEVYGVSVERFRKFQEDMVLGQVVEQVCWLAGGGAAARAGAVPLLAPHLQHRVLTATRAGRPVRVTLHAHPVELLRDVDVVVSPTNTHLSLSEIYKASVSACLRRAAAVRDASGDVVADPLYDELRAWRERHGAARRPVHPGTVAPTGPGALAERGVRRVYHAAVAVPRPGTNDYDVVAQDVADAATRALALMARERDDFTPPLRSVCFALLGAGRGGLPPEVSASALWTAMAAAADPGWDLHLVVRRPVLADIVADVVVGAGSQGAAADGPRGEGEGGTCG
ncbi:hypothetical protein RKE29_17710 [Streptomyces sp. B1866]|uniref:hypothetical protein n=1 Tax=Streptomyces sp. B1866 TaxID=3075431 RepID=UPI002891C027|nr:hypothetical protein [Streptomyces sp. B1866]MDT3398461.1 hypothetical protein [Streptomyces sp. B1866]